MAETSASAERELRALLGADAVRPGDTREYLVDATESRAMSGYADAVVLPSSSADVTAVLGWCYEHDVPVIPRGGGTGFAGGAVPVDGGVVLSLERLRAVRELTPELWRMHVEAGLPTADVDRLARENGLYYPPDPGAAEQSQIGGNIATNAGGPHTFKYGVTGSWVTGLEVVVAPGELITVGGPIRKDVAGYDLRALLIGSEGTLGVITAAWLKLIPAPEVALPVMAFYPSVEAGGRALEAVLGSGVVPAALEFLDAGALSAARGGFPGEMPVEATFALIAEADGSRPEAQRVRGELVEALSDEANALHAPTDPVEIRELWRWRAAVSTAVTAARGGKLSEDIVVPVERLVEAVTATQAIGARHNLPACSWGHAGDGNLHSTFMIDRSDPDELERAEHAAQELFALASQLGGSVSGEHGLGLVKSGALERQWSPAALDLHEQIKALFDPKGLLNPGKKLARA
ncbi:MAG TPA: FAD-linked oxidase C-terminal domain-containing protein [Solirubrobacteraceae bacterium]